MRKRIDGDTILLEADDGSLLLTAEVSGDIVTVRKDDWSLEQHRAEDPVSVLARLAPSSLPGIRFRFFDVSVEVRSNIPCVLDDFTGMYSRFVEEASGEADLLIHAIDTGEEPPHSWAMIMQPHPERQLRLKGDFSAVSFISSLDYLLLQVHGEAEVFALVNNRQHMFVHGGAVEKFGSGIMMPAESGHGKTTLTLALVNAGYRFLSDEFCVLDSESGMLKAFPRSLSVREGSLRLFPGLHAGRDQLPLLDSPLEVLYSVDPVREFGGEMGESCPVRYIIFPHYDPSSEPSARRISGMEAVKRMIQTQSFISLGTLEKQPALDLMLSVVSGAECFDLVTGDLDMTTGLVDEITS